MKKLKSSLYLERKNERGLTLIEIMIVIALLASLMVVLLRSFGGAQEQAQLDQTSMMMKGPIKSGIDMFKIHTGKYPQSLQDLVTKPADAKRWSGPYVDPAQLKDVWGNDFKYELKGREFQLISAGPSGDFNNAADNITYPE
jgi:general secretion pathway protein G